MPGPDEIRRQAEQPVSPAMKTLLDQIPKTEFDPNAMRKRLQMQAETQKEQH